MSIRLRFLAVFLLLISCCGDFTLYPYGSSGGSDPDEPDPDVACANGFPGLAQDEMEGVQVGDDTYVNTNRDRISLAVVPAGTSFSYGSSTAGAGDVILADQGGSSIFVYDDASSTRGELLSGTAYSGVAGLALLQYEVSDVTYSVLFYSRPSGGLYLYDLEGGGTCKPCDITLSEFGTDLSTTVAHPTALAAGIDNEKAILFFLDDDGASSQIIRLTLSLPVNFSNLATQLTEEDLEIEVVATSPYADYQLFDMAFFPTQDYLFVSMRSTTAVDYGWIFRIDLASESTSVVLDTADAFDSQNRDMTGLTIAYTNTTATLASLLVLLEGDGAGQLLLYSTGSADDPKDLLTVKNGILGNFNGLTAIEYDCSNERILLADVPFNPLTNRSFLEISLAN